MAIEGTLDDYLNRRRRDPIPVIDEALNATVAQLYNSLKAYDSNIKDRPKDLNEIKEFAKSIKSSNEEILAILQKNLDKIVAPDDASEATKKRIEIDKENKITLDAILKRLDEQIKAAEKKDLENKNLRDKYELKQQKESSLRSQFLYKMFNKIDGVIDKLFGFFKSFLPSLKDLFGLGFALFGKSLIPAIRNMFTALKIPALLTSIPKFTSALLSFTKSFQPFIRVSSAIGKQLSLLGKNVSGIIASTKLGSMARSAATSLKLNTLDIFDALTEPLKMKLGDLKLGALEKLDDIIEPLIMKFDDIILPFRKLLSFISEKTSFIGKIWTEFSKRMSNIGKILKVATQSPIGKIATKGMQGILKKLPLIGSVFSLLSAFQRFSNGDKFGGAIDILSAMANLLAPIFGPAAPIVYGISLVLDLVNLGRDANAFSKLGNWLESKTGENFITKGLKSKALNVKTKEGPQGDGNSGDPYIVASSADMSYLQPKLQQKLLAASRDMFNETGEKPIITSAFRSNRKQAELWYRGNILHERGIMTPAKPAYDEIINGYLVKGSGNNKRTGHMVGGAIDVQNWRKFRPYAAKYGLSWMGSGDPVHFQINDLLLIPKSGKNLVSAAADFYKKAESEILSQEQKLGRSLTSVEKSRYYESLRDREKSTSQLESQLFQPIYDAQIEDSQPQSLSELLESAFSELANLQSFISNPSAQISQSAPAAPQLTSLPKIQSATSTPTPKSITVVDPPKVSSIDNAAMFMMQSKITSLKI